jgi:LysR family transcriptional regulator (chromosome initiation inhibitor)
VANPALEYPALAALAAVVREGSFERAAAILGVTPSAVSQRIKALEERLGAVLVVRGLPCKATRTGARLCNHFDRVRLLESDVIALLPQLFAEPPTSGLTIRVAVNGDSLSTWFPAAAASFTRGSDALLDLMLAGEDQTAESLRSGEVLAAVTADPISVQGCRTVCWGGYNMSR